MAKDKKLVEAITSMDEDFAQWYTDVVKKAELIDYSSVKGCMIIKPAGYAIWENIHKELDRRFKETGDGFAKAFDITYTDKNNQLVHPFQTSWGMTTRLIACISRKRSCRMPWDALLISRAFYRIIHVIRMAEHCISNLK